AGFSRLWLSLVGLFLCWAAIKKYRRDPTGSEQAEDAPESLPMETPLGLGQELLTEIEKREIESIARQTLARDKERTVMAGGAFAASCALVWLFLAGHPLHKYWDTAGEAALLLAFALLIAFTWCGSVAA